MSWAEQYPYLRAALEDMQLAANISRDGRGSPRHVVTLLHDALEFLLYEILLARGQDIYKNGQSTIGLDAAITQCKHIRIDLPLIGTVRSIQKHRGDAKHHAQVPQQDALSRVASGFRVIASLLIHEVFGQALGDEVRALELLPYHLALYETYRKHRTHQWDLASRYAIAAVLHKHRAVLEIEDDFRGGTLSSKHLTNILGSEVASAAYPPASKEVLDVVTSLPNTLRTLLDSGSEKEAAELAGHAYSSIDAILPGVFDIKKARRLTERLFQTQTYNVGRGLWWSKWSSGDTPRKRAAEERLSTLLNEHPEVVEHFGKPHYLEDDDRYWRWWEFAIFDGTRWETFHLDDCFSLSLESGSIEEDGAERRQLVAEAILGEFIALTA